RPAPPTPSAPCSLRIRFRRQPPRAKSVELTRLLLPCPGESGFITTDTTGSGRMTEPASPSAVRRVWIDAGASINQGGVRRDPATRGRDHRPGRVPGPVVSVAAPLWPL